VHAGGDFGTVVQTHHRTPSSAPHANTAAPCPSFLGSTTGEYTLEASCTDICGLALARHEGGGGGGGGGGACRGGLACGDVATGSTAGSPDVFGNGAGDAVWSLVLTEVWPPLLSSGERDQIVTRHIIANRSC